MQSWTVCGIGIGVTTLTLIVLTACGGQEGADSASQAGTQAGPRGEVSETAASEIELLQYLIEHEWIIGDLVRQAQVRSSTNSTLEALKHAEKHSLENHADLVAARRSYPGGLGDPVLPPREHQHNLEQFREDEYEREVLKRLAEHYAEEVAVVDTALPRIRAEQVRLLLNRIRAQRLHDIQELAGRAQR